MNKSVNKNKKTKLFSRRNVTIGIILAIILIPMSVYAYNKWLDYSDRQRFLKVKEDVVAIQSRLEAVIPEIDWKLEPTCRRAHLTFGDGDASCEVLISGEKLVRTKDEALSTSQGIDKVFNDSADVLRLRREGAETPTDFISKLEVGTVGKGYNNVYTNMQCSYLKEILRNGDESLFAFTFSCVDESRDTWFPRSDN